VVTFNYILKACRTFTWLSFGRLTLSSCAWLSVGCSALLDVDDKQCVTDADCTEKGLSGRCEDSVCIVTDSDLDQQFVCSADTPAMTETVRYQFNVRLFFDRTKAPEHIVAKACEIADATCSTPVAVTEGSSDGVVQFDLLKGRAVYFEVTTSSGLPVLSYTSEANPPSVDNPKVRDVLVPTAAVAESLAGALDYAFDPLKGIVLLEVEDCADQPAAGVHFTENPDGEDVISFYFQNKLPFVGQTVTSYDDVNDWAYGGFGNVKPGIVEFSAHRGVDGPLLRSITALIRSGAVTEVELDTRTR